MNSREGNSPGCVFGVFVLLCSIAAPSAAAETVLKTQRFALQPPNTTMSVQFQVPGPGTVILEATAPYPLNLGLVARHADPKATSLRKDGSTPLRLEFTVTAEALAKGNTWTAYTTVVGADGRVYARPGRAAVGDLKVSFASRVPRVSIPAVAVPLEAALPAATQPQVTATASTVARSGPQPLEIRTQPQSPSPPPPPILIGTGIGDITGPIAEVGMMGYANPSQSASGLHTRLYARAFAFANPNSDRRAVIVTAELGQVFSSLKQGVIRRLRQLYGSRYDDRNVMISATHTHAGPGGYSHHAIFNITSFGFSQLNYDAIVEGITAAIVQADGNVAAATLRVATGSVVVPSTLRLATGITIPGSVNRSPAAHALNRDLSPGMADVNREMVVLRVDRPATGPAGVVAWFPVHNTSLSRDNLLVSSDHKGYAAYLFEKQRGTIMPLKQPGRFVAAFPNGDEGDVSPNIWPNFTRGGGEFGAMYTIGQLEFDNANGLFNDASELVTGPLEYRHMFVRMSGLDVPNATSLNGANEKKLCKAAYGFSFGAGAEDGPSGAPADFREGMTYAQMSAEARARLRRNVSISDLIPAAMFGASTELDDPCQRPKPVLFPTGAWQWTPDILPFQLLRVGTLVIAAVPGEMTTQAGRRLRAHVLTVLRPYGVTRAVITGLANEYSGYVTTPEEYAAQHYEGASTLYGPLTLEAYLQAFGQLANAMARNQDVPAGPMPPDLSANQTSLQTPVYVDNKRLVEQFGQVFKQPPAAVPLGSSVEVTFRAGHPKNDLRTNGTHLVVERYAGPNNWVAVAWDSMPETRLRWRRETGTDCVGGCSFADVHWNVPQNGVEAGTYRIRHFGAWKNGWNGAIAQYEGTTNHFQVGTPTAAPPSPPPPQTPPVASCGGAGQRACCVTERIPSCDQDLVETHGCTGDCRCGGANPGGLLHSIGKCASR